MERKSTKLLIGILFLHFVCLPTIYSFTPYLQNPSSSSVTISWQDKVNSSPCIFLNTDNLKCGTTSWLNSETCVHHVVLDQLSSANHYQYTLESELNQVYSFTWQKQLPKKLRFLILGDTHNDQSFYPTLVYKAIEHKLEKLYGRNFSDSITSIIHTGDIVTSGSTLTHYKQQFFSLYAPLLNQIPILITTGNHEIEHPFFYKYFDFKPLNQLANTSSLHSKVWSVKFPSVQLIGLNTNVATTHGSEQLHWLKQELEKAEDDPTIRFVFVFGHHPPFSELWGEVNDYDAGSNYVKDKVLPLLKLFSKVEQYSYGHVHGYERGNVSPSSIDELRTVRIVAGGGGGGDLDRWGLFSNPDYPEITMVLDHYMFQILEIDTDNLNYHVSVYSLGNSDFPIDVDDGLNPIDVYGSN